MNRTFFNLKIGETFLIDETPKPSGPMDTPKPVYQVCRKASAISYVNTSEEMLGEISYDPAIEHKVVTNEELAARNAPPVKRAVSIKKGKKAPAKKKKKIPAKKR